MPISMKFSCKILFAILFLVPFLSYAEALEIKVTKIASNLYKLEGKSILLQTLNCDELDQHQNPFLKINDTSKKIVFREPEATCDVTAAYKLSTGGIGSYSVVIQYELENWYAILSTKSYIRTKQCASLAQGKKAILSLSGTGVGSLHIDRTECLVEGVYTKLE